MADKNKQSDIFSVSDYKKAFVKNPKAKKEKKEEKLQIQVCNYLRSQYPDVMFSCDLASGLRLPVHIGAIHKKMRSSRGLPDLFVMQPRVRHYDVDETTGNGGSFKIYYGLFIELKREDVRLKNGGLAKSDHLSEQEKILGRLTKLGYIANFACGFEEAKAIIDNYMSTEVEYE